MTKPHFAELLRRARTEQRPVWLLFEAPWNAESRAWRRNVLESPAVAELRSRFACIDVSAESWPEGDQAAQFLMQTLAKRSGWPLSLLLDSQGAPTLGFDALDEKSLAGLLTRWWQEWKSDPASMRAAALRNVETARKVDPLSQSTAPVSAEMLRSEAFEAALLSPLEQSLDFETGLVGQGTRFHYPSVYGCLLARDSTRKHGATALANLAKTHFYDAVGGGFFRSGGALPDAPVATEKLLVENAQFLELYAEASVIQHAGAEFLLQIRAELRALLKDHFEREDGHFAAALSASADFYRVRPADLLKYVAPADRQSVQMFFGIEESSYVPHHPTELPLLATYLNEPPIDLRHRLVAAKLSLQKHRELRENAPEPMTPSLYAEALAVGALLRESATLDENLTQALDRYRESTPTLESGREFWAVGHALLREAGLDQHLGRRDAALVKWAMIDRTWGVPAQALDATTIEIPFLGRRWDGADHLGPSSEAIRLGWLRERADQAEREGDARTARTFRESREKILCAVLPRLKPLGLHGASAYAEFFRGQGSMASPKATPATLPTSEA